MCTWRVVLRIVTGLLITVAAPTWAGEFRIHYAEPVEIRFEQSTPDAHEKAARQSRLSFDAYGRRFEVVLEPNARLLSRLTGEQRAALGPFAAYRGTLPGLAGSWARLTRGADTFNGVLWDGHDLYVVSTFAEARHALVEPMDIAPAAQLVYRYSDVDPGLGAAFCAALSTPGAAHNGLQAYKAVVQEMAAMAAAKTVEREIQVAALADLEFLNSTGDALAEMLGRFNIADGIFGDQLGIAIIPTDFAEIVGQPGPFTSSDAPTLLDQLAAYRQNTAAIRDRGLAHLFTGRDLNGDTAGIAYIASLCDPYYGVSLSERNVDLATGGLILAHELGHNFGAPHDGETGACSTVPQTYLMAPRINSSDQFSSCSINQIDKFSAGATCLRPAGALDVAVAASPRQLRGSPGDNLDYEVDVFALGTRLVDDVTLTIEHPADVEVVFVDESTFVHACQHDTSAIRCTMAGVAPDEPVHLSVSVRADNVGTFHASLLVSAPGDEDASNDTAGVDIVIEPGSDLGVVYEDAFLGYTRTPFVYSLDILSQGEVASSEAVVNFEAGDLTVVDASLAGGSCNIISQSSVLCTLGPVPVGEQRRFSVTLLAAQVGAWPVQLSVNADNDHVAYNNTAPGTIYINGSVDLWVTFTDVVRTVVDQPFALTAFVRSNGITAAEGAAVTISLPDGLVAQSASLADSTCVLSADRRSATCPIGSLPPGEFRSMTLFASAQRLGTYEARTSVTAQFDDYSDNDNSVTEVNIVPSHDVAVASIDAWSLREDHADRFDITVQNLGFEEAGQVELTITVPAGVRVDGARAVDDCTIAVDLVTCHLAHLPGGSERVALLTLYSDVPGNYQLTARVNADVDDERNNDSQVATLDVLLFTDIGLTTPAASVDAVRHRPVTVPFTLQTGKRPVTGAGMKVRIPEGLEYLPDDSFASAGSCVAEVDTVVCDVGALEANQAVDFGLTFTAANAAGYYVIVQAYADNDQDSSNDGVAVNVLFLQGGDAGIEVASRVTAQVGETFEFPAIVVRGVESIEGATVKATFHKSFSIVSADVDQGSCDVASGEVLCTIGNVDGGSTHEIDIQLRASADGTYQVPVTLWSPDDGNIDNDKAIVTLSLSAPGNGGGGGGSGGGGGGSLDWLTLLGAFVLLAGRSRKLARAGRALYAAVAAFACVGAAPAAPPPPSAFGQLPAMQLVRLSPDGTSIAWQQTEGENTAIVILDLATEQPRRIVRWENGLTLRNIRWADNDTLLYDLSLTHSMRLNSGRYTDEFYRTLAINADRGDSRVLLMQGARSWVTGSQLLATETGTPHTVLMETWDYSASAGNSSLGTRLAGGRKDSSWISTVFAVDTQTGRATIVDRGTPFTYDWLVDSRGQTVARSEWIAANRQFSVLIRDGKAWRTIYSSSDGRNLSLEGLTADGESLVGLGTLDGTRVKVWGIPLHDGGSPVVLFEDPDVDIGWVVQDPYTRQPVGYGLDGLAPHVHWIDEIWDARHRALARKFGNGSNSVDIISQSRDGQRAVVRVTGPSQPAAYYLMRFDRSSAMPLGEAYPQLVDVPLGEVRAMQYSARDGTDIPAYLTLPAGKASGRHPLVVLPHGGPESHDDFSFDWWAQFLASRGYAVLQPQFRGSTGFGEAFRLAGRHEWGRRMQDDVTDGVAELIKEGVASEQCVCIVGASYGGYAALAGAAFTPDAYRCAASISGISDLQAMLAFERTQTGDESNTFAYWEEQLGPATDPELARISPVHSAANVKAAVLLMHGNEDTIVPVKQSEVMAAALEATGKRYRLVKLPGEDHWLSAGSTRTQMLTELESFLDENLGSTCGEGKAE